MADEMEIPVMSGSRRRERPEETHVIFNSRELTKEQALEQLSALKKRKKRQSVSSHDPEKRTQAQLAEEAAETVHNQLRPRKTEDLADEPFNADNAFSEKMKELRTEVEKIRSQ